MKNPFRIIAFVSTVLSLIFFLVISRNLLTLRENQLYIYESLSELLLSTSLALLIISCYLSDCSNDTKDFKTNYKLILVFGIIGFIIIFFVDEFSAFIASLVNIGEATNQQTIVDQLHRNGAVFVIISSVIVAPILEELIFRKVLFKIIKNGKVALVVSSLLFGLMHLVSEPSFLSGMIHGISYIGAGFVFGLIYLKTKKNVYTPIIAHFLTNVLALILIFT